MMLLQDAPLLPWPMLYCYHLLPACVFHHCTAINLNGVVLVALCALDGLMSD